MNSFTIEELIDAAAHIGHDKSRINPKMSRWIFGVDQGTHIINLDFTFEYLKQAQEIIFKTAAKGGKILFVMTKPRSAEMVKEAANYCGQYYVTSRWAPGTLTNWENTKLKINLMDDLEKKISGENDFTKLEKLKFERHLQKLNRDLSGIRDMGSLPDLALIFDVHYQKIAALEAAKIKIPAIGIVDTNADPSIVSHPVPGNDDSLKAISFYAKIFSEAAFEGAKVHSEKVATSPEPVGSQERKKNYKNIFKKKSEV